MVSPQGIGLGLGSAGDKGNWVIESGAPAHENGVHPLHDKEGETEAQGHPAGLTMQELSVLVPPFKE